MSRGFALGETFAVLHISSASARRHPAEIARQKARNGLALGVLEHLEEHPELDAVGMRLDFFRRRRQFVIGAWIFLCLAIRRIDR